MAVKVNNFSKNSNILYLDWWEVRGCSKCCLPAPDGRPPILLFFWWADHHTVQREVFLNFPKKDQTSNQVQACSLIRLWKYRQSFLSYSSTIKNHFELERSTFPIFKSKWSLNQQIFLKQLILHGNTYEVVLFLSVSHIILRSKRKLGMDIVVRKSPNVYHISHDFSWERWESPFDKANLCHEWGLTRTCKVLGTRPNAYGVLQRVQSWWIPNLAMEAEYGQFGSRPLQTQYLCSTEWVSKLASTIW